MRRIAATCATLLFSSAAAADEPKILDVSAEQTGPTWRVEVTLRHPDTGWDHYADGWEVLDANGARLGYRELHHPHVDEQPFTRALTGLDLPDGTREIFIHAHCSVDGWTDESRRVIEHP